MQNPVTPVGLRETYTTQSHHRLNPVTSLSTSRYNRPWLTQACPRIIPRGPAPRVSSTSPSKWRQFIHPEGQSYFVLNNEKFPIVTRANLEDAETERGILDYLKLVQGGLERHSIKVPPRCELFLELEGDHTPCNYYFVDHAAKGLFWLEDMSTESLHIQEAMSPSHLERLYWLHVEFFPMHHEHQEQELSRIVDGLRDIISHGQVDRVTSRSPTSPYTADTCRQFLKLLRLYTRRGQRVDGYTLCCAARLAGAIVNQLSHEQQSPQLRRRQQRHSPLASRHHWVATISNLILLGIPRYYYALLDGLYMHDRMPADQWTRFMFLCLTEWTNSLYPAFLVLIAGIYIAEVCGHSPSTTIPSVISCMLSIISTLCLDMKYRPLAEADAASAERYLQSVKSASLGFLPLAIVFSLPKASYMWGLAFLIIQLLSIAWRSAAIAATFLILLFVLWCICVPRGHGIRLVSWVLAVLQFPPIDTTPVSFETCPSFAPSTVHRILRYILAVVHMYAYGVPFTHHSSHTVIASVPSDQT
ncbi:hypothetical protein PAXINDRAFT_182107, partial [Paxillus involutus ATCC 200175]